MEMGGRHPSPYQSYEHSLGHGHVPSECVAAAVAVPVQEGSQHLLAEKVGKLNRGNENVGYVC